MSRLRLALITNIPAPYRVPVFNALARDPEIEFRVFYMARTEPDREWDLPDSTHPHEFLVPRVVKERPGRHIHSNPDVFGALKRFKPDVLITNGFNPTHLFAFAYAQLFRRKHVFMTDGTLESEASLSWVHRLLRKIVLARSPTAIVVSDGGRRLLESYGFDSRRIYVSPLCINSDVSWASDTTTVQDLDFLFSARLIDIKNPIFALDVAHGVALRLGRRVRLGMLGSGPLEATVRERALQLKDTVELELAGHVVQAAVPGWFRRARVFLFPSSWDPWGVVANEACQAGMPVMVSPHAGVAGELVQDDINGYVRPLIVDEWVEPAVRLLKDAQLYMRMSTNARAMVVPYNSDNAARGMAEAAKRALGRSIAAPALVASDIASGRPE